MSTNASPTAAASIVHQWLINDALEIRNNGFISRWHNARTLFSVFTAYYKRSGLKNGWIERQFRDELLQVAHHPDSPVEFRKGANGQITFFLKPLSEPAVVSEDVPVAVEADSQPSNVLDMIKRRITNTSSEPVKTNLKPTPSATKKATGTSVKERIIGKKLRDLLGETSLLSVAMISNQAPVLQVQKIADIRAWGEEKGYLTDKQVKTLEHARRSYPLDGEAVSQLLDTYVRVYSKIHEIFPEHRSA